MDKAQISDRALSKELAAAKALREAMGTLGEDQELVHDTIEGETGLHEAIAAVMDGLREDEMAVAGLKSMIEALGARKARIDDRIDRRRAALEQAMSIGEIKALRLPEATLSIKDVKPGLEIIDEAAIPARFWKAQDPALDKKALKEAVVAAKDGGEPIPGARLTNGGISLQIRRS